MTTINIVRTNKEFPNESILEKVREFLFGVVDGLRTDDKRAWRRLWKRITQMGNGEFMIVEFVFPRSSPFHRRHMAMESAVFDAQDRFDNFEMFRVWLKVGAGFVDWCAGPKGGVVPIPRSISFSKADEEQFHVFHQDMVKFLRGEHAAPYLWRHLDYPHEMMDSILAGFDE